MNISSRVRGVNYIVWIGVWIVPGLENRLLTNCSKIGTVSAISTLAWLNDHWPVCQTCAD